jgi:putative polyketide hydroxylase
VLPARETSVLIIGGGPSGLLSGLLLARAGVPCVICEQHAGLSTHPKAMGITRRTAEIFRELGLLERMRSEDFSDASTQFMIWAKSLAGEELGHAPLPPADSPLSPCAPFHSPQTHTEAVLLSALEAEPLATVLFGHRVRGLNQTDHCVEVDVMTPDGPAAWVAEWVIAADGAGSPIRRMQGIGASGPGDLGHFLNVFFHADPGEHLAGRRALLYNVLREDLAEFFVSVNGRDLWLMHHFLQPGEEAKEFTPEVLVQIIRSAFGLTDIRVRILGVAPWVMSPKVAGKFRHGRIFFTGDAAARLSPAGGMGMNTGLQSAHNLAWKLAAVVHGEALESLLDTYERERQAVSLAVMRHTNEGSAEILRQVDCALKGDFDTLRTLIKESHRQRESAEFDTGVEYGVIRRLPHTWIQSGAGRISSLDLVGRRFVVLAGPEMPASGPDLPEIIRPGGIDDPGLPARAGFGTSGAILVRPDGFIAWGKGGDVTDDSIRAAHQAALR